MPEKNELSQHFFYTEIDQIQPIYRTKNDLNRPLTFAAGAEAEVEIEV